MSQFEAVPRKKRKILITGAAGRVGQVLAQAWADVYDLILVDVAPPPRAGFIQASAVDIDLLRSLCRGVDTVIPLAISGNLHDDWDTVAPVNLTGTWAAFQVAAELGCRRVIFPSSAQTVFNPASPYSASKRWGERLGERYAALTRLSVICLRLGSVLPANAPSILPGAGFLDHVITHRDLARLFTACVEAPETLNYGIFWGTSANSPGRFDISSARRALGYQPVDDAFQLARQAGRTPRGLWRMAKSGLKHRIKKWLNL